MMLLLLVGAPDDVAPTVKAVLAIIDQSNTTVSVADVVP